MLSEYQPLRNQPAMAGESIKSSIPAGLPGWGPRLGREPQEGFVHEVGARDNGRKMIR